jgi:hypothetical protein
MIDYINIGFIMLVLGLIVLHEFERRTWTKERTQLITRIMAKDLPEYIEAQAKVNPIQVVTVADLKREIAPREEGLEVG